jgi:hypothetical protein
MRAALHNFVIQLSAWSDLEQFGRSGTNGGEHEGNNTEQYATWRVEMDSLCTAILDNRTSRPLSSTNAIGDETIGTGSDGRDTLNQKQGKGSTAASWTRQ